MDQSTTNHYKTLGVPHHAISQDIKNAFFTLAKIHHPDKNNGGSTKEFVKVRTAYEVLSDKDQRSLYDHQYGETWGNMRPQTSKTQDNSYESKRERRYSFRRGSNASENTGNSEAKEAEDTRKFEDDDAKRASESLDALMKELERISGRLERREY